MPAPVVSAALYRVTFEATWSAATHADFPAGAHFSPLIGLAHRADGLIFRSGQLASLGMKNMAELGQNAALRAEIATLRTDGTAAGLLDDPATIPSPGTRTDTIRLDAAHPLLTVVTMIAPSPDWFVALEGENLLANGQWVAQRTVPARAYDAGTDGGPAFTSPDQPTLPAAPVATLRLPPAGGLATAAGPPLGQWHLDRIR
ncbi:MAG: spondin domain-containing protein [Hymenobacter sp.]